jgi:hypothetical protein
MAEQASFPSIFEEAHGSSKRPPKSVVQNILIFLIHKLDAMYGNHKLNLCILFSNALQKISRT